MVGEEGDRGFALQNHYAGRRFVKSRINSGFYSSPTASEPYGPKSLLVSIIENTEHETLYFLWWGLIRQVLLIYKEHRGKTTTSCA